MKQLTSEDLNEFISDKQNIYDIQANGVPCKEIRIGKNNDGAYYIDLIEDNTEKFIKELNEMYPNMDRESDDIPPVSQEFLDECKRVAKKYPLINADKTLKDELNELSNEDFADWIFSNIIKKSWLGTDYWVKKFGEKVTDARKDD